MKIAPIGATIPEVSHRRVHLNGTHLHYVEAGSSGSPILLVHGWPESWWAFHRLIPLLARQHRVFAVDIRGFGDSDIAAKEGDNALIAEDLHAFIEHLGLGPVHLSAQDCSGPAAFRLASAHPTDLLSLIAIETGLPGLGLEILANPLIAWYFGTLAKAGAAETFFKGRERELLSDFIFPMTTAVKDAVTSADVAEFVRGYGRQGGWTGSQVIYEGNLREAEAIAAMAIAHPLTLPTLAVDQDGSDFTAKSISRAHAGIVVAKTISGTGHYIAMEAPAALADTVREFTATVDASPN